MFTESDLIYIFYILFFMCFVGLLYIFILIILIGIVVSNYKTKRIEREIDVSLKYDNKLRIYEKSEKVMINKANKIDQTIHHSFRAIDKTNPKQNNLLLETIVEINDTKEYSDKRNIENKEMLSDSGQQYIRHSYEKTTKTLKFNSRREIINETKTKESLDAIDLIEPLKSQQMIKTEIISSKIPIKLIRNRVRVRREESDIEAKADTQEKTVLDIVSYCDSGPALVVSSHFDEVIDLEIESKPSQTRDTLISDVQFRETQALENTIDMKEIPTVGSHLKIKEMPVFESKIQISEKRGLSRQSNERTEQLIEAEVPIIVSKSMTRTRVPSVIPVIVRKTKLSTKI